MARKPKLQARVSHDIEDAIENYADNREDITQPEAIRELLRAGLAQKGHPIATTDGGSYRDDLEDVQAEVRRASTGTVLAVAYLALAVLAPASLAVSVALSVLGILLAALLWVAGMIDPDTLRRET